LFLRDQIPFPAPALARAVEHSPKWLVVREQAFDFSQLHSLINANGFYRSIASASATVIINVIG
jgi:hypothetical protein